MQEDVGAAFIRLLGQRLGGGSAVVDGRSAFAHAGVRGRVLVAPSCSWVAAAGSVSSRRAGGSEALEVRQCEHCPGRQQ